MSGCDIIAAAIDWCQENLPGDYLMSTENPVAGWYSRPVIEALLDEHASGRIDHGKKLWALYILFAVAGRRRKRLSATDAAAVTAAQ